MCQNAKKDMGKGNLSGFPGSLIIILSITEQYSAPRHYTTQGLSICLTLAVTNVTHYCLFCPYK